MLTGAIVIVAVLAFAALALTFVVARRALRLFVRVALVALVALSLLVGYVWFRWQSAATRATPERRPSAPARR
jgi:amino acid permease